MNSFWQTVVLIGLGVGCLGIACFCHMTDVREALLTIGGGLVGAATRHMKETPDPTSPAQPGSTNQ